MNTDWTVLVDFDGTLTEVDADIHIAERILSSAQYDKLFSLFRAYEAVEIGIAEYFNEFLTYVDTDSSAFRTALEDVPIRTDVVSLVRSIAAGSNVIIASEGLDVYILPVLERLGLHGLRLVCNRVRIENQRPFIVPDPTADSCKRCMSCKGSLVTRLKDRDPKQRVVLIGNGASDLCAAEAADVVFARDSLKRGCDKRGISYVEWSNAEDIRNAPVWKEIMTDQK